MDCLDFVFLCVVVVFFELFIVDFFLGFFNFEGFFCNVIEFKEMLLIKGM